MKHRTVTALGWSNIHLLFFGMVCLWVCVIINEYDKGKLARRVNHLEQQIAATQPSIAATTQGASK